MKIMIRNNEYEILVKNKEIGILKEQIKKFKQDNEKYEVKEHALNEVVNGLDELPAIHTEKNTKPNAASPSDLHKDYMTRYNNYMKSWEDKELPNKSSSMRSLLAQEDQKQAEDAARRVLAAYTDKTARKQSLAKATKLCSMSVASVI